MKWGVRRAAAERNHKKLSKYYKKATKKLAKLSLNANQEYQRKRYGKAKINMTAGSALSGGLSAAGTMLANPHLAFGKRALVSAGAGAAGALVGAALNSDGIGARRYSSKKGHAKAISKRDAWRKEMESAFRGTEYGGKKQKQFHREIMGLSNAKNPASYAHRQYVNASRGSGASRKRRSARV